jgi:hypothetical protein
MLDLSTDYAWWCDNVLLTLKHYSLSDHMLLDNTYISVLAWDRMDSVVNRGSGAPSPLTCRTSPSNAATWLTMHGWHWRTTSLVTVKLVPSTLMPPSELRLGRTKHHRLLSEDEGHHQLPHQPWHRCHQSCSCVERPTWVEQELQTSRRHLHARDTLPVVLEGAR